MEEENNQEQNNQEQTVDTAAQIQELQNQLNQQLDLNSRLNKKSEDFFAELKSVKGKLGEFKQAAQTEEEKKMLLGGEDGIKALIEQRVKQSTSSFDETINTISTERDELSQTVTKLQNDIKIGEFRTKFNNILPNTDINKSAYADITDIAMRQSEIVNGKIVFKDEYGVPKTRNKQGKEYTEVDFINEQREKRSYMFEIQQGNDNIQGKNASGSYEMTDADITAVYSSRDEKLIAELEAKIDSGKVILI